MELLLKRPVYVIVFSFLNLLVLQLYSQPSITWNRLYNGPESRNDEGDAICKADGDNFYLAGNSHFWSAGPDFRPYVIKINAYGDTIWTRALLINGQGGFANALLQMQDGGCIVTGESHVKFLVRLNKDGGIVWQYLYPGEATFYDIKKATNGDFICTGITQDSGGIAFRVDTIGNIKWTKHFNTLALHDIITTPDNGCLISGYTIPNQAAVVKLDNNGNLTNSKFYKVNNKPTLTSCFESDNNVYILSGNFLANKDIGYFLKLDQNLNPLDTHIFPQVKSEVLLSMKVISTGRYVWSFYYYSGSSDSSFNRMLITDAAGNIIYDKRKNFKIVGFTDEYFQEIQTISNGDIVFFGDAEYYMNPANHDIFAVRTDSLLNFPPNIIGIEPTGSIIPEEIILYPNYPNPFNPTTKIKFSLPIESFTQLKVYDLFGKVVAILVNENLKTGTYEVDFDASNFASGVYYAVLSAKDYQKSIKILLLK